MGLPQATQVRIYNRALALLGSTARVTNTDDGQAVTDTLNALWPDSVRELLASHPWNCCIKRAHLNRLTDVPAFGDGYYYALPADCLRWLPWGRDSAHYFTGTEEAGRRLLANGQEPLGIRYIALVEDPGSWAPHMVTTMAHLLAWHAAEPITQSMSIARAMQEAYEGSVGDAGKLAEAKKIDGLATGDRERGNVEVFSRTISAARTSGYRAPGR